LKNGHACAAENDNGVWQHSHKSDMEDLISISASAGTHNDDIAPLEESDEFDLKDEPLMNLDTDVVSRASLRLWQARAGRIQVLSL
jgi:hypothetical protein